MNVYLIDALAFGVAGILIVITISLVKSMIDGVSNTYRNRNDR